MFLEELNSCSLTEIQGINILLIFAESFERNQMEDTLIGTIIVICVVLLVYIVVLHIYRQQYNANYRANIKQKVDKIEIIGNLNRLGFVTIILFFVTLGLWLFVDLLNFFDVNNQAQTIGEIISAIFLGLTHSSLMLFEYYRLNTIFAGVEGISRLSLCVKILLLVCIIVICVCEPTQLIVGDLTYGPNINASFINEIVFWVVFVTSLCAMIITPILITYLFSTNVIETIKYLRKQEQNTPSHRLSPQQEAIAENITQQTLLIFLLTGCYLVWSCQAIIGVAQKTSPRPNKNDDGITFGWVVFEIVDVITYILLPLCVWLSMPFAKKHYNCMCSKCHVCCHKRCQKCVDRQLGNTSVKNGGYGTV